MPEGPTLHRAAHELNRLVVGRKVHAQSPQGRFATEARQLDGRVLRAADAYGKHVFLAWNDALVVHVHLGLAGKFFWLPPTPPPPRPQVRLRLTSRVAGVDLIGPMICRLGTRADRDLVVGKLGPDPLRPDADVAVFRARLTNSNRTVGALLMDQSVIAGVGNVIRAEALFMAAVHPSRPGRSLTTKEIHALWAAVGEIMRRGLESGRLLSVAIPDDVPAHEGRWVYRRETCRRCGRAVEQTQLDGRTSYACARCQRMAPRPRPVARAVGRSRRR